MVFVVAVSLLRSLFGLNKAIYTNTAAIFYKPYLVHKYHSKLKLEQFLKVQDDNLNTEYNQIFIKDDSKSDHNISFEQNLTENGEFTNNENLTDISEFDEKQNYMKDSITKLENEKEEEQTIKFDESEILIQQNQFFDDEIEINEDYFDIAEEENITTFVVHNKDQNITNINNTKFLNSSDYSLISIESNSQKRKPSIFTERVHRSNNIWSIPGSYASFLVWIKKEFPINGFTFSFNKAELCSPKSFKLTLNNSISLLNYSNLSNNISNVTILFDSYFYGKNFNLTITENKGGNSVCISDFYILPYDYSFK